MKKYHIVTFGCQMNVHESEKIAGVLEFLNYEETKNINEADFIAFNTCCIRDTAEKKALGNIGATKHLKKKNPNLIICVLGCMPQQKDFAESFKLSYPYVDIILGTSSIDKLLKIIPEIENEKKSYIYINQEKKPQIIENEKIYRTSGVNAWINITYGCNNFCTYCIVPHVRGRERSRLLKDVLNETEQMVKQGYKEITYLGQNVNSYGNDLNDGTSFAKLLSEASKIEGKFRIRFMTSHPKDLTDEVIDVIKNNDKISKYIHLPVQAGSSKILKKMNRYYTKEEYLSLVEKIKKKIPNVGLTTDIMVGFPYEEEEDFLETLDVVKKVRYQNAFTFIYSKRKGTPAAEWEQIPYEIKSNRIQRLIKIQNEISKEISQEYIGKIYEVLVESKAVNDDSKLQGRTDSGKLVIFEGSEKYIGEFVNVLIEKSKLSSLIGKIIL